MARVSRQSDIDVVDRLVAASKALIGPPPEFGPTNFSRHGNYENCASWALADDLGIATGAELIFVARPRGEHSVSLIWRQRKVCRLDIISYEECESNPYFARDMNLPHRVCGPHFHAWEHNRAPILAQDEWELPCRAPLPPQIRRFAQAWPWLADRVNIVLTSEERMFELPAVLF